MNMLLSRDGFFHPLQRNPIHGQDGSPFGRRGSSSALEASPFDLVRFVSGSCICCCCCCSTEDDEDDSCEADRLFDEDRVDLVVGGAESCSCKAAAIAAAVAGSGSVPNELVVVLLSLSFVIFLSSSTEREQARGPRHNGAVFTLVVDDVSWFSCFFTNDRC